MITIRILLVDDHAVVRSGLSKFLMVNKDLELVAEASDGTEAIQMTSLHKPDVILMDLMMPAMDGITATREIHQKFPKVKVIACLQVSPNKTWCRVRSRPVRLVSCKRT